MVAVLVAALVGCASRSHDVPRLETETAALEAPRIVEGTSAATGQDDIQEVITTGSRRRPPVRPTQPRAGSASPAPAVASIVTSLNMEGDAAGALASVPAAAAAGEARYEARLTNRAITREHDEVLSVAVSTKMSTADLRALVESHLKSAATDGRQAGSASAEVAAGGLLETAVWYEFKFVLARIECPDFVECGGNVPQSRSNDPLIWDWSLAAKKWDESRTGNIIVRFYGDQSAGGKFDQSIAAMPPLQIAVSVDRDISYWDERVKSLADLLAQFKSILITIGAIAAILVGWKKKVWRLVVRRG